MTISDYDRARLDDIIHGEGTWFTAHLLRLCAKADPVNLERIRTAFPDEVEAYEGWRSGG